MISTSAKHVFSISSNVIDLLPWSSFFYQRNVFDRWRKSLGQLKTDLQMYSFSIYITRLLRMLLLEAVSLSPSFFPLPPTPAVPTNVAASKYLTILLHRQKLLFRLKSAPALSCLIICYQSCLSILSTQESLTSNFNIHFLT